MHKCIFLKNAEQDYSVHNHEQKASNWTPVSSSKKGWWGILIDIIKCESSPSDKPAKAGRTRTTRSPTGGVLRSSNQSFSESKTVGAFNPLEMWPGALFWGKACGMPSSHTLMVCSVKQALHRTNQRRPSEATASLTHSSRASPGC